MPTLDMVCLLHFSSCPECIEVDFHVLFAKLSWLILVVLFEPQTQHKQNGAGLLPIKYSP